MRTKQHIDDRAANQDFKKALRALIILGTDHETLIATIRDAYASFIEERSFLVVNGHVRERPELMETVRRLDVILDPDADMWTGYKKAAYWAAELRCALDHLKKEPQRTAVLNDLLNVPQTGPIEELRAPRGTKG